MAEFSERWGFAQSRHNNIIEAAPIWLRIAYSQEIMDRFFQDYFNSLYGPGIKIINYAKLIDTISKELECDLQYDVDFIGLLRNIEWNQFYDVVEIIGDFIRNSCDEILQVKIEEAEDPFLDITYPPYFSNYIQLVNELFQSRKVGWRLDQDCKLQLLLPDDLQKQRDNVVDGLRQKELETTKSHYLKAEEFLTRRPIDAGNSIKEIVSSIEALGTVLFPDINKLTLTKMVNKLEKLGKYPKQTLEIMRSLFDYSNSEPGIRHGMEEPIKVTRDDAEFFFHIGTSIIQYINSKENIDS